MAANPQSKIGNPKSEMRRRVGRPIADQPRGSVFPVPAESQTASDAAPEIASLPRTGNRAFFAMRFGASDNSLINNLRLSTLRIDLVSQR